MKSLLTLILLVMFAGTPALADETRTQPARAGVASAHYLATEAGQEILAAGGNAFDAAVAVSATLGVVEPASSGIGGGGFFLLQRASDGHRVMVDAREKAPLEAHRDMYLDENGQVDRALAVYGPLAAGIPGLPAALAHVSKNYGRLPLADSLAPAIRIARDGFKVDEKYLALLQNRRERMLQWPAASAVFLRDGQLPELGDLIRQPDMAATLERLAEHGWAGFYQGRTAELLVEGVRAAGGIWQMEDLARYQVAERQPLTTSYHGYELVTAPPPSSGGVAIAEILNILSGYDLAGTDSVQRVHLITEAMRRAYRDRSIYLGDPDFIDVPTAMLTSPLYAAGLRAAIRTDQATPSSMLPASDWKPGGTDTSHFSIIDREGNLVATTQTVNLPYGSTFMAPGTGFLLNNEMDDFSAKPGEPNAYGLIGFTANEIQPEKRMLSSMSPTLVIGAERTAVLGTPGGSRIITMVLLGILDFVAGNGPASWVGLPRFHHQFLPDEISLEPEALDAETVAGLEAMGHTVSRRNSTWGNMHGVMWNHQTGEVTAASDPRWSSGRAIVK